MSRLRITGWRYGLKKVSMTQAIQKHGGLGLAAAKLCTDRVLDGEEVVLDVPDIETAHTLAKDLNALGADITLEPHDPSLTLT